MAKPKPKSKSNPRLENFHTICDIMGIKKAKIEEMESNSDIIDMVFKGFENATKKIGWKRGDGLPSSFPKLLIKEVTKCAEAHKNTIAGGWLIGNIQMANPTRPTYSPSVGTTVSDVIVAELVADLMYVAISRTVCRDDWERRQLAMAYNAYKYGRERSLPSSAQVEEIEDDEYEKGKKEIEPVQNGPFVYHGNQKIPLSKFHQVDHEPCLLVRIPYSKDYVSADTAKTIAGLKAHNNKVDPKDVNNDDGIDRIITIVFECTRKTGVSVEKFKTMLEELFEDGEKYMEYLEAKRLAEKKKKEEEANEKKEDFEVKTDATTNSWTLGLFNIPEMVKKLLSFDD